MEGKEVKVIAGCDEAGRGCILGPLVVAGISIDHDKEEKLRKIGVRDSKELTQPKREELAEKIEKLANDVIVMKVGPCKIDTFRKQGVGLNRIEAMKFADIIKMLNPHLAYIDSPDTNLDKFHRFMSKLVGDGTELVVKHKADRDHPVVSAASIIAKVERELDIAELKNEFGDFGSGYTSDENTINWLKEQIKAKKELPEHLIRKSWVTYSVLKGEHEQTSLAGWIKGLIRK
jgi:ribonuclease HII